MLILFKHETKKYAYDTCSGAVIPLSSLQYKVAENIELPMAKLCPTALRYQLAKYDANDVRQAYSFLYSLYSEGLISEKTDGIKLRLEGDYSLTYFELGATVIGEIRALGISQEIEFIGHSPILEKLKTII